MFLFVGFLQLLVPRLVHK